MKWKIFSLVTVTALLASYVVFKPQEATQSVEVVEQPQTQVVEEKPVGANIYTPDELLDITNTIRRENNVPSLALDENLNYSASLKLDEMTRDGVFEHISAKGKNGPTYINDVGVACYHVSENLQRVTPYTKQIRDFEGSEGHWNAVNNDDFESVGFAMNERYFVMHFCDKDPN